MTTLLAAEDLRVEFGRPSAPSSIVAVRDVSFSLSGGQLVGLIGPNGAGKTTLLRVLAGLQVPMRGVARVLGKPVLGGHEIVRHHVGFAPDNPPAYEEVTIQQFLRFVAGSYGLEAQEVEERIDFWLEKLWLTDKRDTLIKNLSRGMRQRVTLARTFLPQPHIILLDEPLAGLDPSGRVQLRGVLAMLRDQGCAMIVSSHILSDLEEVSSHIAIIEGGSIVTWSETHALHRDEARRRTYQLNTLNHTHKTEGVHVGKLLEGIDGVSKITGNGAAITFEYGDTDAEAAALLKVLVGRGVEVVSFAPVKRTLEDMYIRSGIKQVD